MQAGLKRRPNGKVNQRVPASEEQVGRKANSSKIARKPSGRGDSLGRRVEHKDGQANQTTSTKEDMMATDVGTRPAQ